jgi:protein-tyrosine-phosphatase
VEAAARFGVDLAGHRSRCTSAEDLRAAATVAVMEFAHLRAVRALLPAVGGPEVVLLGSFAPGPGVEIPDPYGRRPAEYLEVYRVIHAAVRVLLQFDG